MIKSAVTCNNETVHETVEQRKCATISITHTVYDVHYDTAVYSTADVVYTSLAYYFVNKSLIPIYYCTVIGT